MKQAKKRKNIYPMWVALPAILIYTVFTIIPLFGSVVLSFSDWNMKRLFNPTFQGLENFLIIFKDPTFLHSLWNTLLFACFTTIFKIVIGLILALALKKSTRVNALLRTIYYVPCVLSSIVIGVLFKSILANTGLLNNLLISFGLENLTADWLSKYSTAFTIIIILEIWMWAGFNMFVFISGLNAIPNDYYEYANTEGATKWRQFWSITLPLLIPSFTVQITLNITGGLKVFDMVYILTNGGPGFDTQVLSTYTYNAFSMGQLGRSSASAIMLCIMVICISFIVNKMLRSKEVEG